MRLRLEESADWAGLCAIYQAAFGQLAEASLVQRLRNDGDLILSLTAYGAKAVGHIAFSRLFLDDAPFVKGCGLAPLAVIPAHQRQGVGAFLIEEGLKRMKAKGFDLVLVLGEPGYYGRFGFSTALARRLKTLYDGPYLQALALSDTGKEAHGSVTYARAFAELK
ncbi:GNAT family N-acetyltransferase [Microvirga calopogonii]|uniref:GNAT family N-acetyltransferase n=1 Tax=Microvirga calopogonii TaxID=2078013 RepID=UPI000E0D6271|nr:N-acetyltransferase [Microvirga calopogonii]